jgi:hypothetical protein
VVAVAALAQQVELDQALMVEMVEMDHQALFQVLQ